jgi:hypothetical protein
MKGKKVVISENGMLYKRVGSDDDWFRIFGTELFTADVGTGRFEWTLEIAKYDHYDLEGIAFGVVEESHVNRTKGNTSF